MKNKAPHSCEVAVVGSGIMGLAIAYVAARAGKRVVVIEKDMQPLGASIRNFGMVWPVGQPQGPLLQRALKSRELWLEMTAATGCWVDTSGSLGLAYAPDEWEVMQEFVSQAGEGIQVELLSPEEVSRISPAARPEGLIGGLLSHTEMIVDPRQVPGKLIDWLRAEAGVQFFFGTAATLIEDHTLITSQGDWEFEEAFVCCGSDFHTLFPELFDPEHITQCKLQMLRTGPQPQGWHMGPALYGGLTLTHYASFQDCPTLETLRQRIEREMPFMVEWGIHVMMSQNGLGELVIGDSHEYGWAHDPFLKENINTHILQYLQKMVSVPDLTIRERWHGIYAKYLGKADMVVQPQPGVTVVTGLSGAGMTHSFGLAHQLMHAMPLVSE